MCLRRTQREVQGLKAGITMDLTNLVEYSLFSVRVCIWKCRIFTHSSCIWAQGQELEALPLYNQWHGYLKHMFLDQWSKQTWKPISRIKNTHFWQLFCFSLNLNGHMPIVIKVYQDTGHMSHTSITLWRSFIAMTDLPH